MRHEILTERQLNRATLARQMLLERSEMEITDAVAWLLGLQGQVSEGPYQGLWSRLTDFHHEALTALIVNRSLARATSLRGTLHLHTGDDLLGLRPLLQPVLDRMWQGAFSKRFGDADKAAVVRAGRRLLDRGPLTSGALGKALQQKFPGGEALAKAVLMQVKDILVQIPPTRIWGSGHAPILARAKNWLPPQGRTLSREALVRRYLAAYGPASVNDMQAWSGLTKLGADFAAIAGELVTFEGTDGRLLYDLPDAPRPDADSPAPVRFLPLYDNVYLGYDNRRRMLEESDMVRVNMLREFKPAVLVDGVIAAGWTITTQRGTARLEVQPYHKLIKRQIREVEKEGLAFLKFMQAEAKSFEVTVSAG